VPESVCEREPSQARDIVIGRPVALKVIPFDPALGADQRRELAARAEREARAAGALSHPNIVTIHDAGRAGSEFFIVMEHVEGITLREQLERGPLLPEDAARVGAQVASALDYAHQLGVIHRDIKPANILLRPDGLVKIADFGIAHMDASELTVTGQWIGSPAYMSPEQALGNPANALSEIFALGVVLYEMLTGSRPFRGDNMASLGYQIVNIEPPPPSRVDPEIPEAWDEIVMKALAKVPARRHERAGELAARLERLAGEWVPPGGTGPMKPIRVSQSGAQRRRAATAPGVQSGSGATLIVMNEATAPHVEPETASLIEARRRGRFAAWTAAVALALIVGLAASVPYIASGGGTQPQLNIEVTHGLSSGAVVLELDGEAIWSEPLTTENAEGKFRPFKRETGYFPPSRTAASLAVPEGDHHLIVRVISPEGTWTRQVDRKFESGVGETLMIMANTGLRKGLRLEWR